MRKSASAQNTAAAENPEAPTSTRAGIHAAARQGKEESHRRAAQEPARDPRRQPVAADVLEGRVLRIGVVGTEREAVPAEGPVGVGEPVEEEREKGHVADQGRPVEPLAHRTWDTLGTARCPR